MFLRYVTSVGAPSPSRQKGVGRAKVIVNAAVAEEAPSPLTLESLQEAI